MTVSGAGSMTRCLRMVFFESGDAASGGGIPGLQQGCFPVMLARAGIRGKPHIPCLVVPGDSALAAGLEGSSPDPTCCIGDLLGKACTGLLLPLIIHNLNNVLVGLVGNLDLASMFSGQPERCAAKVEEARAASAAVRGYLDVVGKIADASPPSGGTLASAIEASVDLAVAGKGRSVVLAASASDLPSAPFPAAAVPACWGLVCASLLSLAGAGSMTIEAARDSSPPGFAISWNRSGTGHAPSPGLASIPALLVASAATAVGAGAFLEILRWDERSGHAVIALPAGASS